MTRLLALLAGLTAGILGIAPVMAGDSWADQIIDASKLEDQHVARHGTRVASLGNVDIGVEKHQARTARGRHLKSEDRPQPQRTRVASLGPISARSRSGRAERPRRSLTGGSVNWIADAGCLNGTLRHIVGALAADFGPITVNSTCRSRTRNASVGGARKSYHLRGEAVDFRVHSNISAIYASLRDNPSVGGLKHYGGGLFHIDTGPRRSW